MNRKNWKFADGRKIEVGQTYDTNNGLQIIVLSIWADKYAHLISYQVIDTCELGDTPPNGFYYWVWGA